MEGVSLYSSSMCNKIALLVVEELALQIELNWAQQNSKRSKRWFLTPWVFLSVEYTWLIMHSKWRFASYFPSPFIHLHSAPASPSSSYCLKDPKRCRRDGRMVKGWSISLHLGVVKLRISKLLDTKISERYFLHVYLKSAYHI